MKPANRLLPIAIILNLVILGIVAYLALQPVTSSLQGPPSAQSAAKMSSPGKLQFLPGSSFTQQSQPATGEITSGTTDTPYSTVNSTPEATQLPTSSTASTPAIQTHISIPVILLDPDPGLNFDQDQLDELDKLRQNFADAVGGENQNPADKAYISRWQEAQPEFDAQFQSIFGDEAYNKMRAQAARQEPD